MSNRVSLIFHTLRYSKPRQVLLKAAGWLKRTSGLTRIPEPPSPLRGNLQAATAFLYHDPWNSRGQILAGFFRFLNRTENLGRPVDYGATDLPLLWQFNLHYFHWLHLLGREEQIEFCLRWIENNPVGKGAAWHPYVTSLRIVNWCKLGFSEQKILQSLYRQAAYLSRHIEAHHQGNHLLENARALIFAGCFFTGQREAGDWLRKGLEIYRRETPVQILADDGHFERSPMYHAIMLEGYLDVLNVLPPEHADRALFIETARRMGDFLLSVTKPDGEIALLNDSTREIAAPTKALLDYELRLLGYQAERRNAFAETGYYIHSSEDVYLIIDGGKIGPDALPAHAHAGIFSYELSINGKAFLVDTGVYEYAPGEMRQLVRGTPAHNTVAIDGKDQAECWGSFRVARRYPPEAVSFSQSDYKSYFQGRFGGYARLIGDRLMHERAITCDESKGEIVVEDRVSGEGTHLIESFIHLHPEIELILESGCAVLKRGEVVCIIETGGLEFRVEDSWYCPEFGLKQKNKRLALSRKSLPTELSYKIRFSFR